MSFHLTMPLLSKKNSINFHLFMFCAWYDTVMIQYLGTVSIKKKGKFTLLVLFFWNISIHAYEMWFSQHHALSSRLVRLMQKIWDLLNKSDYFVFFLQYLTQYWTNPTNTKSIQIIIISISVEPKLTFYQYFPPFCMSPLLKINTTSYRRRDVSLAWDVIALENVIKLSSGTFFNYMKYDEHRFGGDKLIFSGSFVQETPSLYIFSPLKNVIKTGCLLLITIIKVPTMSINKGFSSSR